LLAEIDELDRRAEISLLSPQEVDLKLHLKKPLIKLLREDEIYWIQRSKTSKLLQEDDNTRYFHLVAHGKYGRTKIIHLEQDEEIVVGDEEIIVGDTNLNNYITKFYKRLFGP